MKGNIEQYGVKYYSTRAKKLEKSGLDKYKHIGVHVKNGEKKKVLAHIKADDKEFVKQIKEDKKLSKELKKPKKK